MKLFVKLSLFILIGGLLLPFTILKGDDGKPLMSFSDIKLPKNPFANISTDSVPGIEDLKDMTNLSEPSSNGGSNQVYKWTDNDGNLQFSTSPPAEGIEYTVKGYDPNQNVIQSVGVEPAEKATVLDTTTATTAGKKSSTNEIGNPYTVEKVEKLFEDAEGIETLLKDRLKNQDAIIGQ